MKNKEKYRALNPLLSAALWMVLTAAGLAVSWLPRNLELAFGKALGRFFLLLNPKRLGVARDNLRRCFPDMKDDEREEILRDNCLHYGILVFEILHMFAPWPGHYRRYTLQNTRLENFDNWRRAHAKGRGTILITAHLANWEIMAAVAIAGLPVTMATRRLKPEWLNKKIEAARLSVNVRSVYQRGLLPTLIRRLRNKECVGFVMDQYAAPPMGIGAKFFDATVDTLSAPAILAQRTGAVPFSLSSRRDEQGIMRVVVGPEIELGKRLKDTAQATQVFVSLVERWIRETPSQWLWVHRRFKNAVWPDSSRSASSGVGS